MIAMIVSLLATEWDWGDLPLPAPVSGAGWVGTGAHWTPLQGSLCIGESVNKHHDPLPV